MDNDGCTANESAVSVTLKDNSNVVQSVVDIKTTGKEAGDANNLSTVIADLKKTKEEVNDFLTSLVNAEKLNDEINKNYTNAPDILFDETVDDDCNDVDDEDDDDNAS